MANAKERHVISRRVVTHAFLHWQPQSFEECGSHHSFIFLLNQREVHCLKRTANRPGDNRKWSVFFLSELLSFSPVYNICTYVMARTIVVAVKKN